MSGGEPSSIKRIFSCAAKVTDLELAAPVSGLRLVQMWVCDLVMSRKPFLNCVREGGAYVSGLIQKIQTAEL